MPGVTSERAISRASETPPSVPAQILTPTPVPFTHRGQFTTHMAPYAGACLSTMMAVCKVAGRRVAGRGRCPTRAGPWPARCRSPLPPQIRAKGLNSPTPLRPARVPPTTPPHTQVCDTTYTHSFSGRVPISSLGFGQRSVWVSGPPGPVYFGGMCRPPSPPWAAP